MPPPKMPSSASTHQNRPAPSPSDPKEQGRMLLLGVVSLCVILLLIAYIIIQNPILLVADSTFAGAAFTTIIAYYFNKEP